MTDSEADQEIEYTLAWAKQRKAEGKAIGLNKLVGHRVPKAWFHRMITSGYIAREKCPRHGIYAYWWRPIL